VRDGPAPALGDGEAEAVDIALRKLCEASDILFVKQNIWGVALFS